MNIKIKKWKLKNKEKQMKNEKWKMKSKNKKSKNKKSKKWSEKWMLSKNLSKFLLNFQNDQRKSTMNSLNLTTPSLPHEKPEKRQQETHFGAKYVFASHLPLPVEVAYKKAYR